MSIKGQYVVALLRSESLYIVDWKEGSGKNIHVCPPLYSEELYDPLIYDSLARTPES